MSDITVKQSAVPFYFEFVSAGIPVSSREYYPEEGVVHPPGKAPEDPDTCLDVLRCMLSGDCYHWVPDSMKLVGTSSVEISPYGFFSTPGYFYQRTISGEVVFGLSTGFFATYGEHRVAAIQAAKERLTDVLEKFKSMCATPGALTWATNRLLLGAELRLAADVHYDGEILRDRQARARAEFPELDPPEFAGNRVLPESVYRQ